MTMPPPQKPRTPKARPKGAGASPTPAAAAAPMDTAALMKAMRQLMEPLATLAIARGIPFVTIEDMFKAAVVDAARAAHPNLPGHRMVSRISTVTGINRREVTRLTQTRNDPPAERRSPATRVFTRWLADSSLKTSEGEVMSLPRQGPAPSFEALAQSVTRDVHPRSLLDELCRLGLARLEGDTVHVVRDSFVPRNDSGRMLGFLGSNVGDHLRAAVANVLTDPPAHLEQAVFADGLSKESVQAFDQLMRTQWKALLAATVPTLQKLIDDDSAAHRPQDQRVRVGLYTYSDRIDVPVTPSDAPPQLEPAPKPKGD